MAGEGLFGLAIGLVFSLLTYLLLVFNAEKVTDQTLFARALQAAVIGGCVGIIPLVIATGARLLSPEDGILQRAGALEEAKMLVFTFGLAIYPVVSGIIWAVLSWQSERAVPARGIGDG